ncbi:MAG: hypothetical protein NUV67_00540, partial [archaeon]|nr:hypothetical protein [archaeon]
MQTNWLLLPAGAILGLLLVLFLAFFSSQPPVSDAGDVEYVDVEGDEYLAEDYISPEEVGIGEFDPNLPDYDIPTK